MALWLFLLILVALVVFIVNTIYQDAVRDGSTGPKDVHEADLDAILFQDEERYDH